MIGPFFLGQSPPAESITSIIFLDFEGSQNSINKSISMISQGFMLNHPSVDRRVIKTGGTDLTPWQEPIWDGLRTPLSDVFF